MGGLCYGYTMILNILYKKKKILFENRIFFFTTIKNMNQLDVYLTTKPT